jgi:hypothetical protein
MLSLYENETYDDDSGETISVKIPNLRRIRSLGYIRECIAWNPDINTDRVSAMDMVMILREDRAKYTDKFEEDKNIDVTSYFHDDPFLDDNWQKAMRKSEHRVDTSDVDFNI